ncbi:MAG TPA: BTAD domain-containing putative transcriptional regulator [Pseudonocardiaceae bacterium]|jgi:DNA-binding SARP family transcriptional activator|nr:BTAD domain-containing putative transcriptional regulator [Pseudonocardiaceae bacterium]
MSGASANTARVVVIMLNGVRASLGQRQLRLGPPQRCAVAAALLLNAGRVVTTDRLVAAVWGDAAPSKAAVALQAHVSALRKAFAPDLGPRERDRVLRTVSGGYLVEPGDVEVDVTRFTAELATAEKARDQGDLDTARTALRSALARYPATALAGVPGPFAEQQRELLAIARLTAVETLVEVDLALRPEDVLDHDLTELLAAHPHRERLHGLRMRLLAHNGRRADALAAYARARQILVTDLGIEPGAELRRLHQQILAGDRPGRREQISTSPTAEDGAGQPGRLPHQPMLLGRAGVLNELAAAFAEPLGEGPGVVVLHGMAGVGKTATAIGVATRLADRFPGGGFFLAADADDAQRRAVLARVERAGRCLLVLDDVTARTPVRALLPANPAASVLITSRYRGRHLPFAARVQLLPLAEDHAREVFGRVIGLPRAQREPQALRRLVAATAGVPAILLSFAEYLSRRPTWSLAGFADSLLSANGDRSIGVHLRALFDRDYADLDSLLAKVLRTAAGQPRGELTTGTVAALTELPMRRAELLLEELVDRSLLDSSAPARYTFPPLVRSYVRERTTMDNPLPGRRYLVDSTSARFASRTGPDAA